MKTNGLVLVGLLLASGAHAGGRFAFFDAPQPKVFAAALAFVGQHYRVEQVNAEAGFISFRSGGSMSSWEGQDGSLVITTEGSRTKVSVNTEKRGRQVITWGEGGQIQKKILEGIRAQLAAMQVATSASPPVPVPAVTLPPSVAVAAPITPPLDPPLAPVAAAATQDDSDTRLVLKNGAEAIGILVEYSDGVYTLRLRDGRVMKYQGDDVERMEALKQ